MQGPVLSLWVLLIYQKAPVKNVKLRLYLKDRRKLLEEQRSRIKKWIDRRTKEGKPMPALPIRNKPFSASALSRDRITQIKPKRKVVRGPFMVADFETVLNSEDMHIPYAAGVMRVDPESK